MLTSQKTASREMRFSRNQACMAALLFAVAWLNYIHRQILSVLVPVMKDQIGLSQTQYAWAINSFLLAYGFMYAGSGLVLDRVGSRIGLALFVACWCVASGLHAATVGFGSLLIFRFLLGL